ncbi:unnamed protein product [Musa banksii]
MILWTHCIIFTRKKRMERCCLGREKRYRNYKISGRTRSAGTNFLASRAWQRDEDRGEVAGDGVVTLGWRPELPLRRPGFPRGRWEHRLAHRLFRLWCNALRLSVVGGLGHLFFGRLGVDPGGPDRREGWRFLGVELQPHSSMSTMKK